MAGTLKIQPERISFDLPAWVADHYAHYQPTTDTDLQMRFVIAASDRNVERGSGGPFAAAIFQQQSGELVSLGVNLVTTGGMSILHAEMVAIALAQRKLGVYDLGGKGMPRHVLVTSTEPCAMCYGAIPWSGVVQVVTAARGEDAQQIGFDEGPKPEDWVAGLASRGIEVVTRVQRDAATAVLQRYQRQGGLIYNSREQ